MEIPFNVDALSLSNVFNRVLFTLELLDLFASELHFLLKVHDLFFELVNGGFEAKWLLRAQSLVGLAYDGGTGARQS